jgi:hypothetical protein
MQRIEIPLQDLNKERDEAKATNKKISMTVGFLDSLDLAAIFGMFLVPFLHTFLEETGKYFMFPFAAASGLAQAGLKWWQVYLDRGKSRTVAEASVETLGAAAITVAVVGVLAAPLIFAAATPIIFTAAVGGRTLWNAGSALFYLGKALTSDTPEMKRENLRKAAHSTVATVAGILATAAVVGVFLLAHAALAPIGIAAGLFSAAYLVYSGVNMYRASQKKKQLASNEKTPLMDKTPQPAPGLSNGAKLTQTLRASNDTPSWAVRKDSAPKEGATATRELKLSRSGSLGLLAAPGPLQQPSADSHAAKKEVEAGQTRKLS